MDSCSVIKYTADNIVISGNGNQMKVLVVQRKYPPFQGEWAFPGGFIEEGEEPLAASLRELDEETHLQLSADLAIPLTIRQAEGRDPRGRVVTYPFLFWIGERQVEIKAGDDAREAQWVLLKDLGSLAFDHGAILCEALGKFWKQMPSYDSRLEGADLPSLFSKKKYNSSIYFGGSFNPWHQGHDQCLEQCQQATEGCDLVVVPDYNPWKVESPSLGEHCFFQRYLQLAYKLESHDYSIYSGFWGSETPNPTINWLPHTRDDKRGLLIGDDNFMKFTQWKDYDYLLRCLEWLITVPRLYHLKDLEEQKSKLLDVNAAILIQVLSEHPFQELSSTQLRKGQH